MENNEFETVNDRKKQILNGKEEKILKSQNIASNQNSSNTEMVFSENLVFTNPIPLKIFFLFLKKHILGFSALISIILISGFSVPVGSFIMKETIDFVSNLSNVDLKNWLDWKLIFWPLMFFIFWEVMNIIWRTYDMIYLTIMPQVKKCVIDELFNEVQNYPFIYFKNQDSSLIPGRLVEAARSIEMAYAIFTEQLLRKIILVINTLLVVYFINPILFIIFFVWLCIFSSISAFAAVRGGKYAKDYSKAKVKINGILSNSLLNIFNVKVFNGRLKEVNFLTQHTLDSQQKDQKIQFFMFKIRYVLGFSCSLVALFAVYFGFKLKLENILTLGELVVLIELLILMSDDLWDMPQEMGDFMEEWGAFKQSCDVLKNINQINKFKFHQHETNQVKEKKLIVQNGQIEFKNVSFGYVPESKLFTDKSVVIKGGERVALVGFSGSGKSSFANLIARLYDIQVGDILIDNQSIYDVSQKSLNHNISFIAQEPILFERTIFENISYGCEQASLEEVMEAAKLAFIHEKIMTLPNNYYSVFGAKGINLSSGEKQRIIIARALLKNAPILILDEATSALDNVTEKLVSQSLNELMKNKTAIVIAHRLYTLTKVDRILVFDAGKIVETGAHAQLLEKCGFYYELWNNQFEIK